MAALILCLIYGGSAMAGGLNGAIKKKIESWSGYLQALSGAVLMAGGVLFWLGKHYDLRLIVIGLVGISVAALRNGFHMHGKPTLFHHVARLVIAVSIVGMIVRVGT
ncbi:MAG: hypothetical protein ABR507_03495 [Actinomycetota bacterium]